MIALLQRTTNASVAIDGNVVGSIERGLVVLVAVEKEDDEPRATRLLERILKHRVFPDDDGRMNRSLVDAGGGLLVVPNFTLAANTNKGHRPSFAPAAAPEHGHALFSYFVDRARKAHHPVATGVFGADMQVSLINDGPVTLWLQVRGSGLSVTTQALRDSK